MILLSFKQTDHDFTNYIAVNVATPSGIDAASAFISSWSAAVAAAAAVTE